MTDTDRERWDRIDALFDEALAHPREERDDVLRASDEPPDVVERVRRLLEVEREAEARIGESARSLADEVLTDADPRTDPGDSRERPATEVEEFAEGGAIGPYRVLRRIGRGGMGSVYLAERSDPQYARRVALKVVKRGMDTDEVLGRFRREGRILGRLEHPNIGRMYDAAVTVDGRPYLVLEYIEGRPIDEYCDAHRLAVDARVELFLDVCAAVSFAHGKLVLHRDLKPSNILVTDAGPKLLDFGIAKLLGETDAETSELTKLAGRRLTPEYASPEQLAGDDVSTASDVYSLAVILHQLLVGARPAEDRVRPPSGTVAAATTEPWTSEAADARRSTPHRLARRLRGDLDTILLKALHRDIERRYPSVEAFAADLRRHLDGLPVTARPDSVAYRARKFVSRHRLPVLSGSGLGVSVLFFAVASAFQQAETARERDRANAERARTEQVASVMEEMFSGAGLGSGERIDTMTVRAFLDRSADRILAELVDQPAVQGSLLRIFGSAQHELGRLDEADSLLTAAISALESAPDEATDALRRARLELGNVRNRQGRWVEARTLYERWLAEGSGAPADVALVQSNIATALVQQGHADSAAVLLDSALAIHAAYPEIGALERASALTMRAGAAQRLGELPVAVDFAARAVDAAAGALDPNHPQRLVFEHNHAFMVYRSGRPEAAEPLFASIAARYRAAVGESVELATLIQNQGNVLRDLGRPGEALPLHEEAAALARRMFGVGHPALSYSLDALGTTLEAMGRHGEALGAFEEGLSISETAMGPGHPATAIARMKHAASRCLQSVPEAATVTALFEEAQTSIDAALPPDHPVRGEVRVRRGRCLIALGDLEGAAAALRDGLAALEQTGSPVELVGEARRLLARIEAGA